MASTKYLSYNGFDDFQYIRIAEDSTEAVYAEGDAQRITTRRRLAGTAVISADDAGETAPNFGTGVTNWNTLLTNARRRLSVNGKELIYTAADNSTDVVNVEGPDDDNGPFVNFAITEQKGSRTAMVVFEINWTEIEPVDVLYSSVTPSDVLSNTFTQTFSRTAENPLYTWRVTGTLRTRGSASDSNNSELLPGTPLTYAASSGDGSDPDMYRRILMPTIPVGYRLESEQYRLRPDLVSLDYDIVCQQTADHTPGNAYVGRAEFAYRRALNAGDAIGRKIFSVELSGDADTSRHELLAQAIEIARNRIKFTGENRDFIDAVEVAEIDVFGNRRAIRFSVTARVMNPSNQATQGTGVDIGQFANVRLGAYNTISLEDYVRKDPYGSGSGRIRAFRSALFTHDGANNTPDAAIIVQVPQDDTGGVVASDDGESRVVKSSPIDGDADDFEPEHLEFPYVSTSIRDSVVVESTGMIRMPANDTSSPDEIVQVTRPRVYVTSVASMSRIGKPPERSFREAPPGGIVRKDDFKAGTGRIDANGNHIFTAHHVRVVELTAFTENNESFQFVQNNAAAGGVSTGYIVFWPPNKTVAMPNDPRIKHEKGQNLFIAAGDYEYPVGNPEPYFQTQT